MTAETHRYFMVSPRGFANSELLNRQRGEREMTRKPTAADIRKSYKARDCEVRISRDGHVTFRHCNPISPFRTPWLEGRWISEYRFTDNGHVALT